ncbi:hypothetical protein OURE66S_00953 [Oligella ureolytica]
MVIRNIRRFTMIEFAEENPLAHQVMENFEDPLATLHCRIVS